MTNITELAQSLKAAADSVIKNYDIEWFETGRQICTVHKSKINLIGLANPANVLALVEALEKAQQRITQLESRTVKLLDDEDGQAYGFAKWSNSKLPATAGTMTIAYCEDAWRAAFEVFSSAAGIKMEAE
ncbi:TPA: hypothetical protein IG199_000881 [Escherichia coli]|nr:hypothetical protein [Escherichia coli]